jgi:hypothetical protein
MARQHSRESLDSKDSKKRAPKVSAVKFERLKQDLKQSLRCKDPVSLKYIEN